MDFDSLSKAPELLAPISVLYTQRLKQFGADPRGVFWRNEEGQKLRFQVMAGILNPFDTGLTLTDLGCGYGAFFDFLKDYPALQGGRYLGFDICEDMLALAAERITDPRAVFAHSLAAVEKCDYAFASGTFNLMGDTAEDEWVDYIKASLVHLWSTAVRGMAFNMLDRAAGASGLGLYRADADEFSDFCKRELSPDVTLRDDYPLNEWTLLVRRPV